MERTESHRDQSRTIRKERRRRQGVDIIFTFGPPASAAAQDACHAVGARDGVEADEAWTRVAYEALGSMNEVGPDGMSELDRIASVILDMPVFVFGAAPSLCFQGGSVCPALHVDLARIVDHYGNPVGARRFVGRVVKGIMAEIADGLGSEWVRAVLVKPGGRTGERSRRDGRRRKGSCISFEATPMNRPADRRVR